MLNRDPASWPPFPGPDAPEAARLRWAVERFLPPDARTLPTIAPASSSRPGATEAPVAPTVRDRPEPAELARVLGLPLDQLDRVLTIRVPWLEAPLWFVPTEADAAALAAALAAAGVSRGVVWTARELADLLAVPGLTTDAARTVALAKLGWGGEVTAVRPRPLPEVRER